MEFKQIAIIGLGLIGGSLAKALKQADANIQIAAFDYKEVLDKALSEKVIDIPLSSYKDTLNYNLIFIALPIDESLKVFKELSPLLKENQIISDLCSVKGIFAESWELINSKGIYIGAHPMAGKEKGGFYNSDSLLFENSIFIISNDNKSNSLIDDYSRLIQKTGARITFVNPYLHDKIISKVSHLPQLLSILLVNQADKKEEDNNFLDFGAGGFRDMTRIAASDYTIWEPIISSNKQEIINSLSEFKEGINKLISAISENDFAELSEKFNKARTAREEIPFNNKGFFSPLYDISIFLKDEPGVIARLSKILFENNINIKDLELLKIREGSGGNFKLYFESENDAKKAKQLLEESGFKST